MIWKIKVFLPFIIPSFKFKKLMHALKYPITCSFQKVIIASKWYKFCFEQKKKIKYVDTFRNRRLSGENSFW